jgi:hypothetical protein
MKILFRKTRNKDKYDTITVEGHKQVEDKDSIPLI